MIRKLALLAVVPLLLACRNVNIEGLPLPPAQQPDAGTLRSAPMGFKSAPADAGAIRLSVAHDVTGALAGALGGGALMPVKLQLGPQPFLVDAGGLRDGDGFTVRVLDAAGEETVYERSYSFRASTVSAVAPGQADWTPDPGSYWAEMWVNGRLTDRRTFFVE